MITGVVLMVLGTYIHLMNVEPGETESQDSSLIKPIIDNPPIIAAHGRFYYFYVFYCLIHL